MRRFGCGPTDLERFGLPEPPPEPPIPLKGAWSRQNPRPISPGRPWVPRAQANRRRGREQEPFAYRIGTRRSASRAAAGPPTEPTANTHRSPAIGICHDGLANRGRSDGGQPHDALAFAAPSAGGRLGRPLPPAHSPDLADQAKRVGATLPLECARSLCRGTLSDQKDPRRRKYCVRPGTTLSTWRSSVERSDIA
jgi:hypothetical protein